MSDLLEICSKEQVENGTFLLDETNLLSSPSNNIGDSQYSNNVVLPDESINIATFFSNGGTIFQIEENGNSVNACEETDVAASNEKNPDEEATVNETEDFEFADSAWINLLHNFQQIPNQHRVRGYVDGEQAFVSLIECFQTSTMTKLSVRSSDRFYKLAKPGEKDAVCGRILTGAPKWSRVPLIPYDGVPFVSVNKKYFGCRHGGKERLTYRKENSKQRNSSSAKTGCPADAEVLEVWRVPELACTIVKGTNREKYAERKAKLSQVRRYIREERFTKRFYLTLPLITKHNHIVLDPHRAQPVNPRIIAKIYQLVREGIEDRTLVKHFLRDHIVELEKELGVVIQQHDKSYYPTHRNIYNHVRNARTLFAKQKHKIAKDFLKEYARFNIPHQEVTTTHEENCEANVSDFIEIEENYDSANAKTFEGFSSQTDEIIDEGERSFVLETAVDNNTFSGNERFIHDDQVFDYAMEPQNLINELFSNTQNTRKRKASEEVNTADDVNSLLRAEIENSLTNVVDSVKQLNDTLRLRLVYSKLKSVERFLNGEQEIEKTSVKTSRRSGLLAMVKKDVRE